jgi:hypothetical protein
MQYGQDNYNSMILAQSGVLLEDYILNPRLENATFFGWWFVDSTATNTIGTTLTDFLEYNIGIQGGSSAGLSGCLLRGNNLSDLLDTAVARTNLGVEIGVDVQAFDADALFADVPDNLTAGFTQSVADDGTQSGGTTYTPSVATASNYKQIVNGGAFPLGVPTLTTNTATEILIYMTNNASAGALTTTAIDKVTGDTVTLTNGHEFILRLSLINIGGVQKSSLNIEAQQ